MTDPVQLDKYERSKAQRVEPLQSFCAASFAGEPPESRKWHVPDLIPARNVTDLAGDGGNGKSLLALQLAVATVTGTDWIGIMPERGPALYLSCEDELAEFHRRLVDICTSKSINVADLSDLNIADLTQSAETELMTLSKGRFTPTKLLERLRLKIANICPKLIVLDTRADLFGGSEIDRSQVRTFVRTLRHLCLEFDTTILMLSHPSITGMSNGTGQSGSTAWGNSVRSRLYLEKPKVSEGNSDPAIRILDSKKANYATSDHRRTLIWQNGVFRPDGDGPSILNRLSMEKAADEAFIRYLREFTQQGRHVSDSSGANYAPHCFAGVDEKFSKKAFKAAMERHFKNGTIIVERTGPPSRPVKQIVEVE